MQDYPMTRTHRLNLARAFATVPRVDVSIDCALEDQMGTAMVDNVENPNCFMIELDRFFCYLAGDWTTDTGREFIGQLPENHMYMAGTSGWDTALTEAFGERAMRVERYSFSSDSLSSEHMHNLIADNPNTPQIQRVTVDHASGHSPYLEIGAFDSPEDFVARGIGYFMMDNAQIIGAAYSSLVCSDAIEVSIVVDADHRRRGIATGLAAHLLDWCLAQRLRPNWDAANPESCMLATKLGYRPRGSYVAYFLKS